jgi:integrase
MPDDLTPRPVRRPLPFTEWPAADQTAWAAAHRRGSLLEDDGKAASWAPVSSSSIAMSYGRFLAYMSQTGVLDPAARPQDRVTPDFVQAYIAHLRTLNSPGGIACKIIHLSRAIAVMAPTLDWRWLSRIGSRLKRSAPPFRDDRARLVPLIVIRDLAFELMRRAETGEELSDFQRALFFRDGLMIAILCACHLRLRNFAGMAIGTNFQRRGEEWWVSFEADETKTKRPIEKPLPAAYTGCIERYISHHREQLVRRSKVPLASNALWVSTTGRPCTANDIGIRIRIVTQRELGRGLNMHLFRKLPPTELAIHDPEHVGIAQVLLDHTDYRMTQQAYNLGRAIDAARRHQSLVRSIRGQIRGTRR